MRVSITTSVLLLAGDAAAFWRMPCRSRSGLARIDPLVSNGTIAEHAHAIHGSSGFGISAGYEDLMAGDCTSCEVTQDKSVYWHPALYFQHASGEFEVVPQIGGMLAYYLLYPNAGNTSLSAFPAGFEMIAGDTNQRNFTYPVPDIEKSLWTGQYAQQDFLRQAAVGFNCLNYGRTPEGSLFRHFLPDKAYLDANCADGVRFEMMFPSCWNGKDITSDNKKDHVAYPSQVMTGDCPKDFPERLPSLFYETIWGTDSFIGKPGTFVIANGDRTGYGYHADFMMGWDQKFLQSAVNTCTNPSGQIEDCPLFNIQSAAAYSACDITPPAAIAKENLVSALAALPGNVVIANGPAPAGGATPGGALPVSTGGETGKVQALPTLSYTPGVSVAPTDQYVPGAIFAAKPTASSKPQLAAADINVAVATTLSTSSIAPPAPTPAPTTSASETETFVRTEYSTAGGKVMEVLWVEELVTVTASETVTVPGRKRHVHKHARRVL